MQHFFLLLRKMARQPLFEQRRDSVRQAQHNVAGKLRARIDGGGDERMYFVISQARNDGSHQHADGNPRLGQSLDG